jgi:hypothetical protein
MKFLCRPTDFQADKSRAEELNKQKITRVLKLMGMSSNLKHKFRVKQGSQKRGKISGPKEGEKIMLKRVYWSKLNDSHDKITAKAGFRKESNKLYEPYELYLETWEKEESGWVYKGSQPEQRQQQLEAHPAIEPLLKS